MKKTLAAILLATGCSPNFVKSELEIVSVDTLTLGQIHSTIGYFDDNQLLRKRQISSYYNCATSDKAITYLTTLSPSLAKEIRDNGVLVLKDLPSGQRGYAQIMTLSNAIDECTYVLAHVSPETHLTLERTYAK